MLGYVDRNIWGDAKASVHGDLNLSGLTESLRFTSYCYDPVIGKYFAQARFYDSAQGRMLSKDPVKRGLNSYRYCDNDPVDYVDPTGEIANILIGGFLGGAIGGTFGFAGSAVSQLMSGKGFDIKKSLGAAANGAVVGAVKGAMAGSGVGLPLALAADFTAGTIGSALEQKISEGEVDVRKSITSGLTNAVSGAIYGNNPMKSLGQAFGKGAAAGAATSGINYLSDVLGPQKEAVRSSGIQYQNGGAGGLRARDPRRGCSTSDPFTGNMGYGSDYGYQYNVPVAGESQSRRGFSLADFGKEVLTGAVTGGLASAAFYGAGKAVGALKESIKSKESSEANYIIYNKTHEGSLPKPKGTGPNGGRLQSHHGLQQQWAVENLSQHGYDPKLAPTVTIETGKGMPHTTISNLQNFRRDTRVASGAGKWSSSLQDEMSYIVSDFRTAGFSDSTIKKVLNQQYAMLDKLGILYERIKF